MAQRQLCAPYDVHGGDLHLRFHHHENEQARSRAAGKGALLLCIYSLGFGLASSLFDTPVRIDNAAHIGGLLGGALSGFLLVRPFEPEARARPQPLRIVAVALGICALLAMLAAPLVSGGGPRGGGEL